MNTKPPAPSTTLSEGLSRRHFSKLLATSALGTLAAPTFLRGQNLNSKLSIAIIGAGGRGGSNMADVGTSENIVAVCDVAEAALDSAQKKFPQAKRFTDFRKLYEAEKTFDAVVVSTCEHTHAFATLPALKLRKHVYCEKPLTYNISEARTIREAAANAKLATQMGTQIHAGDNYRRVVELVQSGAIGPAWMHATYEYGARGELPPVRLTWHQGEDKPEIWTAGGIPKWDSGVLFIGTNGRMLLSSYDKHVLLPGKDFAGFKRPEPFIPNSIGHHAEWIHVCKTGAPTT